jgi:thymidylate synthase (FAD)
MKEIKLLDQGYVRLILTYGSDQDVIEDARMSTDKGFQGWEHDERLLNYLYTHKHMTPFEGSGMKIEVKAPILVFREWQRHRTQCISGDSQLIFNRPCDGKAYRKSIREVVRSFSDNAQRSRLCAMNLRGSGEVVHITDAWASGIKKVYKVTAENGFTIKVSKDHLFKTPEGQARIVDGLPYINGLVQISKRKTDIGWPVLSEQDLALEIWKPINEYYDVSQLGRVRTKINTRKNFLKAPELKVQTINSSGRAVVNINNSAIQVSRLVAEAFFGDIGDYHVLHKDDNPLDNRLSNLKLGDDKDNCDDRNINGGAKYNREVPLKVISVEEVGEEETYDISVTGNHWFNCNGLIVHNSYNEMSGRYVELPNENYLPSVERIHNGAGQAWKAKSKQAQARDGAQNSLSWYQAEIARKEIAGMQYMQEIHYQKLLAMGLPKELARINIPVSRYSRMRATASLRNWLAFLTLREDPSAQWEIRQYAHAVSTLILENFPRTHALYIGAK